MKPSTFFSSVCSYRQLLIWSYFFTSLLPLVLSSGVLEFRFNSFENSLGRDSSGRCCSSSSETSFAEVDSSDYHHQVFQDSNKKDSSICLTPCRIYFRVCLKHFQHNIDVNSPCTFGEITTPVLGNNSIQTPGYIVPFFFNFSWPRTFSYIVDVGHEPFEGSRILLGRNKLIYQLKVQTELAVSSDWTFQSYEIGDRSKAKLNLALRVTCDENYFGNQCSDYCRARDDDHGHFTCSDKGQIRCLHGWKRPETYCREPECLSGCHSEHGTCERPNECRCRLGWEGSNCNKCVRNPKCVHGYCNKPGECICEEGWGGIYCNQDLNFCTNHRPCRNKGTCYNSGQGSYTCVCPPNFTGRNCETELTNCDHEPCQNGATCRNEVEKGNYTCNCPLGYTGRHCKSLASLCDVNPCEFGGTCIQGPSGYLCICPPGDFDENNNCRKYEGCHQNPCKNDGKCSSSPTDTGYICTCEPGFSGSNCEVNQDDCLGVTCENGGTCRDGIRDYRCHCPAGFSGKYCQDMVDLCRGFPCANGGTCIDSDGTDFTCTCAPGFEGKDCSININECSSNPCLNQGTCIDRVNEYTCTCPPGFSGSFCQYMKNGSTLVLAIDRSYSQVSTSDLITSESLEEWTTESAIVISLLVTLAIIIVFTVVTVYLVVRRRRLEADRKKSERLARSQNEANFRRNKCLDDDPFKGSMIVNTLREGPDMRSTFQLNRTKSATISKSSNNIMYESNLKLSAPSQHFGSDPKRSRQFQSSEYSATLLRTKSNNKLQSFHDEVPANNMRTKSTCKLNGVEVDPLVLSIHSDVLPSHHQKVWMGSGHHPSGVHRVTLTPPSSSELASGGSDPASYWSHASSSLYRSVHNLHHHNQRERPQSAYYSPKSLVSHQPVRRVPELMDPRAEYVDFKSNIINC